MFVPGNSIFFCPSSFGVNSLILDGKGWISGKKRGIFNHKIGEEKVTAKLIKKFLRHKKEFC